MIYLQCSKKKLAFNARLIHGARAATVYLTTWVNCSNIATYPHVCILIYSTYPHQALGTLGYGKGTVSVIFFFLFV